MNYLVQEAVGYAIVAAVLFSIGHNLVRVGVIKGNPLSGAMISVFVGLPLVFMMSVVSGQFGKILLLEPFSIFCLSMAGLIHFAFGRGASFFSTKLIGVSRTYIITSTSVMYTIALGLLLLNERLLLKEGIGVGFMILGIILISISKTTRNLPIFEGKFKRGYAIASLAAISWGFSPILVSMGLSAGAPPISGLFLAYLSAGAAWSIALLAKGNLFHLITAKKELSIFAIQGIIAASAQMVLYLALSMGPVIIIAPINSALAPIVTVIIAYFFLKSIERITLRVWISAILVMSGTYLVSG